MVKKKYPKRKFTYFFYNDELHRALHIHQGEDTVTAFNYPRGTTRTLVWSDVKRRAERAWTTTQVGEMVNRSQVRIEQLILAGEIQEPPSTYNIETKRKYKYLWREKDIMELHRYLCTVHYGRPRNDGHITPLNLPSAAELRAMIRQQTVLYVKTDEGFVPSWKANHF